MRADPKDLIEAFKSKGAAFKDFLHDLLRAVPRYCRIDPV